MVDVVGSRTHSPPVPCKMALYQLPKQTLTHMRCNVKGAPGQSVASLLPQIFHTFLERLADPAPTFHLLRSPFLRPLLNKRASKLPIYNLLSPAHAPTPEDLAPDSPLQNELIEFFQEKQQSLINNMSVEENMPVWVYCNHRRNMLGPPQLVINESYNDAISRGAKHPAMMHAISVLSHQLGLMLQAEVRPVVQPSIKIEIGSYSHLTLQSDPDFKVSTSRRPSDLDASKDFNAYIRASFTDFQLESKS